MSTFSITYPVNRELVPDHAIICPKCGYAMEVFNLYTKRKRFDGTVGYCTQNCKHEDGSPYFIYSYDLESVFEASERIKSKICEMPALGIEADTGPVAKARAV